MTDIGDSHGDGRNNAVNNPPLLTLPISSLLLISFFKRSDPLL